MKKNKCFVVSILCYFFMTTVSIAQAEEEKNWYDAISVGFGYTGIFQGTSGNGLDKGDYAHSVDMEFAGELAPGKNLFIVFESGDGDGSNDNLGTRSVPNYDSFVSIGSDTGLAENGQRINISQVYYEGEYMDGKLTAAFGLMDHHSLYDTNAFANDETEQFLNGLFVRSAGPIFQEHDPHYYAYTLMLVVRPTDLISLMYTYGKNDTEDVFSRGLHVFELGLHPVFFNDLPGNYSVDFLLHDIDYTNYRTNQTENNTGFIVNIDQMLCKNFGVFARLAFQDNDLTSASNVKAIYTGGVQINGDLWGRSDDAIGIAHGELELNDSVTTLNEGETVTEAYYRFAVNDHFALSADFQYFTNIERALNREVAVFSLRTQISF